MALKEYYKKHALKEGSLVEFEYAGQKIEGTIIPSNDETLMVKLASGYNAGFETEEIKKLIVTGESKSVGKAKAVQAKKKLKL